MGQPLNQSNIPLPLHPLDGAATATFVYKSRPLSDLPWFGRLLVWFLHIKYGWSAGESYEGQGIFTDYEKAGEYIADFNGWKRHEYKVNQSLPEETCQFGRLDASAVSADRGKYRQRKLRVISVERERLGDAWDELRALYSRVKNANDG